MARIDDYISAKTIAVEKLSAESFEAIIKRSGFEAIAGNIFGVPFLDRVYRISFPDFDFKDDSKEKDVPIQEQVIILHYMLARGSGQGNAPKTSNISGNWISYREIPGASFYFSAFVKRAIDPLKKVFGRNISAFSKAAQRVKGVEIDAGNVGFEFKVFPGVPLQLILWEGDEEFLPEANIIFDDSIGEILSPEDVAWLSGMLVYRLIALAH